MDAGEFETTLEECETRLDRLRALYEQWFQGMERLEPMIPKKELERKVQVLRRNIPRNTRLRFRFQQLTSKYMTYKNYWTRVSRQIEEGTYRRDIMKVRRKRQEARSTRREAPEDRPNPADGISIDVDLDSMDIEAEIAAASADASAAVADRMFAKDDVLAAIDNLGSRSLSPPGAGRQQSLSPFAIPSKAPGAGASLTPLVRTPTAGTPTPKAPATAPRAPSTGFSKPPAAPKQAAGAPARLSLDLGPVAPPAQKKAPPATKPQARTNMRAVVPKRSPAAQPRKKPAVVRRPPSSPPGSRVVGGPDDEGMKRVYRSYVDARKKNNERVDNVRFESVKKSIQKQLPKLQQKHKGKKIDFEVVIRNGKVGLKPVPKG